MNKRPMRALAEILRPMRLEEDAEAAWHSFCDNCRDRISDARRVWVLKFWVGSEDDPDVVETWYCEKCIHVDESREFKGKPPPAAEKLP